MKDGIKTFTHENGVVILSVNQLVTDQLKFNSNFVEIEGSWGKTKVFVSKDLVPEVKEEGLPLQIKKYLASH